MGMFIDGLKTHNLRLMESAGVDVVFVRGNIRVNLKATIGSTDWQEQANGDVYQSLKSVDFIVDPDELKIGNQPPNRVAATLSNTRARCIISFQQITRSGLVRWVPNVLPNPYEQGLNALSSVAVTDGSRCSTYVSGVTVETTVVPNYGIDDLIAGYLGSRRVAFDFGGNGSGGKNGRH